MHKHTIILSTDTQGDGWMDGWMNGWIDGWKKACLNTKSLSTDTRYR
jgi:hypothetical protein